MSNPFDCYATSESSGCSLNDLPGESFEQPHLRYPRRARTHPRRRASQTFSEWHLNTDVSLAHADNCEQEDVLGDPRSRWDDEWMFFFLMAVLTIGIGNAKAMSILKLMMERLPHRAVTHKQVESYWQNFRRKLRRQYGLPPGEMPGNRHIPRMEDMPEGLRHLAERWLRSDA